MNNWLDALAWLVDPENLTGPGGVPARTVEHLGYTLLTLVIAAAIALPIGYLIGHTGRGRGLAVAVSGGFRALPTLGLVTVLALLMGLGILAPLTALVILAIPPLLAGAYAGVGAVERSTIDSARAVGMTEWQVFAQVELPLSLPLAISGLRSATLQVIATWTVAAILPVGGLGRFMLDGLPVRNYAEVLGGAIVVILLALVIDAVLAGTQRIVIPRGVKALRLASKRMHA
ncbi:ABC transporter permease [Homoserinimonas sp. OAct 916]|uniref:ABC transporter permease n=1 Tax=Homoserinimonas sp. OAct 916 TaxID=2211450 RepID=UPI000DBE4C57|nr:ABC transporter permease [Homoserinimonas sp. OAct 916]